MNVCGYVRTAIENEGVIEKQIKAIKEYAAENNHNIVEIYIDKNYSGITDDRPEFRRMIMDSKKELFEVVVCYKFDRIMRDLAKFNIFINQMVKNRVRVISCLDDNKSIKIINEIYDEALKKYGFVTIIKP